MSGFSFQVVTELRGFPELFLVEQAFRANAEKGPGQLVVVSVAAGSPSSSMNICSLRFRSAGLSR